ncbi:MAG: SdpI family protein [Nanoarchaeota archaeon]
MISLRKSDLLCIIILGAMFIIGAYVFPIVDNAFPTYGNSALIRLLSFLLLPLIALTFFLLFFLIPDVEVHKKNIAGFMRQYTELKIAFMLFFLFLFIAKIVSLFQPFALTLFALLFTALFLYYVGYLLKSFKRNYFIGIITPWTLASDIVWERTHKIGSFTFRLLPIVILLGILIPGYIAELVIIILIANIIFFLLYSYAQWYQLTHEQRHVERAVVQEQLLRRIAGKKEPDEPKKREQRVTTRKRVKRQGKGKK